MKKFNNNPEISIVFFGETWSGKTCLLNRYFTNTYKIHPPTVMPNYLLKEQKRKIDNNEVTIRVRLIDTPGQIRYISTNQLILARAQGIVLIYDITSLETFTSLNELIKIANQCNSSSKILIGLKLDLEDKRVIQKEEAEAFSNKYKMKYYEISALNGEKVNELFDDIMNYFIMNNISFIKEQMTYKPITI